MTEVSEGTKVLTSLLEVVGEMGGEIPQEMRARVEYLGGVQQ